MIPYESENKYSACFYQEDDKIYCTVKGALEKVLEFCNEVDKKKVLFQNEELAKQGYRVIALANNNDESAIKKLLKSVSRNRRDMIIDYIDDTDMTVSQLVAKLIK